MKKSQTTFNAKSDKLSKADYYDKLAPLQLELNGVARWLLHTGKRLVVVIEGRAAGDRGRIRAMRRETAAGLCGHDQYWLATRRREARLRISRTGQRVRERRYGLVRA